MVRALCEVQLKDIKKAMELMLSFNEIIDRLTMANSVRWSCVEERGWSCLEKDIRF